MLEQQQQQNTIALCSSAKQRSATQVETRLKSTQRLPKIRPNNFLVVGDVSLAAISRNEQGMQLSCHRRRTCTHGALCR